MEESNVNGTGNVKIASRKVKRAKRVSLYFALSLYSKFFSAVEYFMSSNVFLAMGDQDGHSKASMVSLSLTASNDVPSGCSRSIPDLPAWCNTCFVTELDGK